MDNDFMVYKLSISSYKDSYDVSALHYYGEIHRSRYFVMDDGSIKESLAILDLCREITKSETRSLAKKDGSLIGYTVTNRFNTEKDIRDFAVTLFNELASPNDVLIGMVNGIETVLAGSGELPESIATVRLEEAEAVLEYVKLLSGDVLEMSQFTPERYSFKQSFIDEGLYVFE